MEMRWDLSKSELLKKERGVSFEKIIQAEFIAVMRHAKRSHQNIMIFQHRGYVWVVPYVRHGNEVFLKTLFPSRKYTKMLKRGELP
jgi:uncharacterized DUF497 family protein